MSYYFLAMLNAFATKAKEFDLEEEALAYTSPEHIQVIQVSLDAMGDPQIDMTPYQEFKKQSTSNERPCLTRKTSCESSQS